MSEEINDFERTLLEVNKLRKEIERLKAENLVLQNMWNAIMDPRRDLVLEIAKLKSREQLIFNEARKSYAAGRVQWVYNTLAEVLAAIEAEAKKEKQC